MNVGKVKIQSTPVKRSVIFLALALAACGADDMAAPAIPFAPLVDATIKDPDNPTKLFRVDFAKVQQRYPLSRTHLAALSPENVKPLTQEKLDQIYGRLTAGPLPNGAYRSEIFFAPDGSLRDRLSEIVGGFEGRLVGTTIDTLLVLVSAVWTGKVFDRQQGVARTSIENLGPLEAALGDPGTIMTTTIPREGPLRFIMPEKKVSVLFPAKVYCGQSLLDGRREFDHHRLQLRRGHRRLSRQSRQLRRPRRPAAARRNSHGPSGILSRAGLCRPRVPIEFFALRQASRGRAARRLSRWTTDHRGLLDRGADGT